MVNRLWILGAGDPEMAAIEQILVAAGERVAYAVGANGRRVHPGNAYAATGIDRTVVPGDLDGLYLIECSLPASIAAMQHTGTVVIDHHRKGDPGYGQPPESYRYAASLGQVALILFPEGGTLRATVKAAELMGVGHHTLQQIMAADHCLEAAYRGRCPGVDPDALMKWRVESRAAFQKRPVADVLRDVEAARKLLVDAVRGRGAKVADCGDYCEMPFTKGATTCSSGGCQWEDLEYADLLGQSSIPELPEAAAREGIPFIASVTDRHGHEKVVLQAASPELVTRFLAGEIVAGLVEMYGDPQRGIAGGYTKRL